MTGVAIQQGTTHSTQTTSINLNQAQDLKEIIAQLLNIKDQLGLPFEILKELNSDIRTLQAQDESPKPKISIIKEAFASIKSILEGVATNAATPGIIAMINSWLGLPNPN